MKIRRGQTRAEQLDKTQEGDSEKQARVERVGKAEMRKEGGNVSPNSTTKHSYRAPSPMTD